jgi:DUF1009 family protein
MPTPLSRFLPPSFDPNGVVTVIAGQFLYPTLMVEAIRAAGVKVRLLALDGETEDSLWNTFAENERERVKVGQVGKMLKALKALNTRYSVMVGQVSPGRLFRDLHPDLKAIALLATLKERNAESIYGAICREINAIGIDMLDARAFMDAHIATEGVMTGGRLKADRDVINFGIRMAKEIARIDVGQGVVVRKGTVLAVEALEGTDDMLLRANKYKSDQLVFVKTPKPGQNWNIDVPVFGMKTLEVMDQVGIQTACLEVDGALILEKDRILKKAKEWNIELFGYTSVSG